MFLGHGGAWSGKIDLDINRGNDEHPMDEMITLKLAPEVTDNISFNLNSNNKKLFVKAASPPMYVHEVHLLSDGIIDDFSKFEANAVQAVKFILLSNFNEYNTMSKTITASLKEDMGATSRNDIDNCFCPLWALNLVDLYICPNSKKISHTLQVIVFC